MSMAWETCLYLKFLLKCNLAPYGLVLEETVSHCIISAKLETLLTITGKDG